MSLGDGWLQGVDEVRGVLSGGGNLDLGGGSYAAALSLVAQEFGGGVAGAKFGLEEGIQGGHESRGELGVILASLGLERITPLLVQNPH